LLNKYLGQKTEKIISKKSHDPFIGFSFLISGKKYIQPERKMIAGEISILGCLESSRGISDSGNTHRGQF
jgi:hypothetical protein